MTNNEKLNAINALWGYTCYIKDGIVRLIDSDSVDRVPTDDEENEIEQWVPDTNSSDSTTSESTANNVMYLNENPKSNTNPENKQIIINSKSGELFSCTNCTTDKNIWIGQLGTVINNNYEVNAFDFFKDNSAIAFYRFNKNAHDDGGLYNGVAEHPKYRQYSMYYSLSSSWNTTIHIKNLPFDDNTEVVTICAWLYWDGHYSVMPFGFTSNDIYVNNGYGFNTGNSELIGITNSEFVKINKRKWAYHIITFKKDSIGSININGIEKAITETSGTRKYPASFSKEFSIFGWPNNRSYRNFGEVARLRIINRELTSTEKSAIYSAELKNYGDML